MKLAVGVIEMTPVLSSTLAVAFDSAVKVFVGPHLHHLHGPKNVVVPLIYHDDHMHVRIR